MRGFFGIAVYQPKTVHNIGTLWRSANIMGASFIATIGQRYKHQASDTLKTYRHIPLFEYRSFEEFKNYLPHGCRLIGVELDDNAKMLGDSKHPQQVCYLLGSEDNGLPPFIMSQCQEVWKLHGDRSMNVAVAGSIIMYDRINQKKEVA